jgi:hypothetical protein
MFLTVTQNLMGGQLVTRCADEPFLLLSDGVDHQSDAVRMVEERALRAPVRATEECTQVWMAVIPANCSRHSAHGTCLNLVGRAIPR